MRSVIITGGTGFFGQAFTRRALNDGVERVCIFSRDEYKQALMREAFSNDERLRFFIGCVRDRNRLTRAMQGVDVVVHAAALKRIETGFYNPSEMVLTNVFGTMNVIEAATEARVTKVIGLSSDKAFQPISAYGHSKAMAECLLLASNNTRGDIGPFFTCTRYGNVAGSTGSVIPTWRRILLKSDTVPVSDPDCTRFWMSIDEAVELVIQSISNGGELVIPALPAFRLGDLAEAMNAKMNIVGLGQFEKKHESMDFGHSSDTARQLSVSELRDRLHDV